MLKKIFTLVFCILFSLCTYAQVETKRDTIGVELEQQIESSKLLEQKNNLETINNTTILSPEELKHRIDFISNQRFQLAEEYVGPTDEGVKLGKIMPNTYDYTFYNYVPIEDNLAMSTASTQHSYLSIGASREIVANLIYQASERLTISGGMYVAKYRLEGQFAAPGETTSHFNDLGFNASLRFKIHERIYLKAHGAYSINSYDKNRNLPPSTQGMFPQTYFGGGAEFKINNKIGVEGGMVRQLNPATGKWKNTPYIMPVFYLFGR